MDTNNKPYISIVMPVYNNERYFPVAVNSIICQSFSNWELIIVDDGSTDNTSAIADNFAASDSRIRVIHQENQWIYNSFNNGIAEAEGKYVLVVNSDDTLNPEALMHIHNVAAIDDADIVMFNLCANDCDENQNILIENVDGWADYMKEDFSYNDVETIRQKWYDFHRCKFVNHQCVYKTTIAKRNKYRTDIYGGDYYYNIQIADQIKCAAGTSYVVYNFFQYKTNTMNASLGKYYGYEHNMFNEFYFGYKELFERWGTYSPEAMRVISQQRLQYLTTEIRAYNSPKCTLDMNRKLDKIFSELSDGVVYECACNLNAVEEYESRILSALRELFIKEIPNTDCAYYFIYELIDSLLKYEKDDEDIEKICNAIAHPLNIHHIGRSFYLKLRH